MKRVTITMQDSDYELLRKSAYDTRQSVGGRAGELVREALGRGLNYPVPEKAGQEMMRSRYAVENTERKRGIEAEVKLSEVAEQKSEGVTMINRGNVEAELKRLRAANKAMEGRYAK